MYLKLEVRRAMNQFRHKTLRLVPSKQSMAAANQMQEEDENATFFVAVHVGAGYHAPSNEKALRSAIKRACLAAASLLRKVSFSLCRAHI